MPPTKRERIQRAAECYAERKAGLKKPSGSVIKAQGWFPNDCEARDCCAEIAMPTPDDPETIYRHCHHMRHIAELFGVSVKEIQEYRKTKGKEQ